MSNDQEALYIRPKPKQSVRQRMAALLRVSGVTLAALLVIGITISYFIFQFEQQAWQGRQAEAADNAAQTVGGFIRRVQDSLVLMGLLDVEYLKEKPEVTEKFLRENPAFLEFIRLDPQGQIIATAYQDEPILANPFTIPQSNWFLEAKAGQLYLGDIGISSDTKPYLIMALPAPNGGVVAARQHMILLWDIVNNIEFGESGRIYLVDQRGHLIAYPNPEAVLSHTTLAGRPEFEAILAAGAQWRGSFENLDRVPVRGVTAPVPGTKWVVITELSETEARAVSRTTLLFNLGILLLGALILFGSFQFLERFLFRPMSILHAGVERIGQGDLEHRIEIKQKDEISQVATAFNQMAARLQGREAELIQARDQAIQLYADLEMSEKRYRTLFEDSKDTIFITAPDGQITDINPAGVTLLGRPREELLTMKIQEFCAGRDQQYKVEQLLAEQEGLRDFELKFRGEDGAPKDGMITATARRSENGTTLGYYGILRDVTDLKQAERERLKLTAIQRELAIAHSIQQSLLPSPRPGWGNLDMVCYSRPAREVGGDLYAYHAFHPRHLANSSQILRKYAVSVGDVSGKGMPAALLMAVSLASFQSSIEQRLDPKNLLAHLDQAIMPYTKATRQNCALVYIEITPPILDARREKEKQEGMLRVANAGCITPVIRRATGAIEWIEIGGIPLGIGLGARFGYDEISLNLKKGDQVILTSDGIVEANNTAGEMFGFERLEETIAQGPPRGAEAMLSHLRTEVENFIGNRELHDDLTMVVIQV